MATTQQRFMRRGTTLFFFLKEIASDENIPSRAEFEPTNATNLSDTISDVEGWSLENTPIDTPDMGSTFATTIPGEDKADNSSITFYEDKVRDTIETLLSKGVTGYIAIMRKGDVPLSKSLDVFPIRVGSRSPSYSTASEPAKFKVTFGITEEPTLDAAVPAKTV
ncbi:phage tail tube protein [Streptomyces sp. NPDC055103]